MKHRALVILGVALGCCYVAIGLSRIRFDVDITRLLPEHMKEAEGARLILDHYSSQGELVVTVEAGEAGAAGEAAESLAAAFRSEARLVNSVVSQAAWETDEGGEEMLEFVAWALLNRPTEELEALERSVAPGAVEEKLEEALDRLAIGISPEEIAGLEYDPLGFLGGGFADSMGSLGGASEFSSADGRFRVLYVAAKEPVVSYREKIGWVGEMGDVVSRWQEGWEGAGGSRVEVGITGEPAFVAEISGGMERDMRTSAGITLVVIGLIFWVAYRRFRPLVDLLVALLVIFLLTLATGGILFRELSAISIGFASILIGLTVDYGVILYQEARVSGAGVSEVRRSAGRGILWASLTTAAAFGSLALGADSVPGLAELGVLVASGVLLGAVVMFGGFVYRAVAAGKRDAGEVVRDGRRGLRESAGARSGLDWGAWVTGIAIVFFWGVLLVSGRPEMDATSAALRPRDSEAHAAMDRWAERLGNSDGIVSVIVSGADLGEARMRLDEVEEKLRELEGAGIVASYGLPSAVWPLPEVQQRNLEGVCARLAEARERLREAVDRAGFEETAFGFAGAILGHWTAWRAEGRYPVWPVTDSASRAVSRFIARKPEGEGGGVRDGGGVWGLGMLMPEEPGNREHLREIRRVLDLDGVYLSGGRILSMALAEEVPASIGRIFAVLSALVVVALVIAFRRVREVVLTLVSVVCTMGAMLGAMQLFGVSWNFMNLAALLLALGAGLDYSIHILIDLRRHGGDAKAVRGGVGRALLVCGLSSVAGFGSLAWAGNLGLASLGQACAIALAINTAVAVFLLPKLWGWFPGRGPGAS